MGLRSAPILPYGREAQAAPSGALAGNPGRRRSDVSRYASPSDRSMEISGPPTARQVPATNPRAEFGFGGCQLLRCGSRLSNQDTSIEGVVDQRAVVVGSAGPGRVPRGIAAQAARSIRPRRAAARASSATRWPTSSSAMLPSAKASLVAYTNRGTITQRKSSIRLFASDMIDM